MRRLRRPWYGRPRSRCVPLARATRAALLALLQLLPLLALGATTPRAEAQDTVKIGIGFGLAFLPVYICQEQKLVEKHARLMHLDVKASYERLLGPGPVQDAIASSAIDMGPFGIAPLLAAWESAKDKPQQILAVSGITTMPLDLLTDRVDEQSIADLKPTDRIAMPTLSAPQMYLLQMQSEKVFGQYDRLRGQVVVLSHAEAMAALVDGGVPVTAYFASPPFTQIALRNTKIHRLLSSEEVINGKASFLIMAGSRGYIEAHPKITELIDKAMDDAAQLIRNDPLRAAQIYLAHEPSQTLDGAAVEAVLRQIRDEFGSALFGIEAFADFMGRHGELKAPPRSWREIVAPALINSPSG